MGWEKIEFARALNQSNIWRLCWLREVYGPQPRRTAQVLAQDRATVLKEKEKTLNRFVQHFDQLLNVPGTVDKTVLDDLPGILADKELHSLPSRNELNVVLSKLLHRATCRVLQNLLKVRMPIAGMVNKRGQKCAYLP